MTAPIRPVSLAEIPDLTRSAAETAAGSSGAGGSFQDAFAAAVERVQGSSDQAAASVERFLSGEGEELHTAVLAVQKADLTFQLFLQARNKVVSAYQEIMRMQL
jgi:flagellar hook-basal body complex protein FliE